MRRTGRRRNPAVALTLVLAMLVTGIPGTALADSHGGPGVVSFQSSPGFETGWVTDRAEPAGWSVAGDALTVSVDTDPMEGYNTSESCFRCTEGRQLPIEAWVQTVEVDLALPNAWENVPVRAGLWVHGQDAASSYGIIEFATGSGLGHPSNQTTTTGLRYWDTDAGTWTDVAGSPGLGASVRLGITLNVELDRYDYFVDGAFVGSGPAAGATRLTEVFLNHYNFGADAPGTLSENYTVEPYTVNWSSLVLSHVTDDIAAAVAAAPAGSTINVGAGTYTGPVVVDKSLAIVGEPGTTILEVASNADGFTVNADDVRIEGMTIVGPHDAHYTSHDWSASDLAATTGVRVQQDRSGLTLHDNAISNVRTGMLLLANVAGSITSSVVDNTKGSILLRGENVVMSGNSPGPNGNEWDIVLLNHIGDGAYFPSPSGGEAAYGAAVMSMSADNGGMTVLDRRYGTNGFLPGFEDVGNRSHIVTDPAAPALTAADDFDLGNGVGNHRQPFGNIPDALDAVVHGGTLVVRDGTYVGDVVIDTPATFDVTAAAIEGGVTIDAPGTVFDGFTVTNPTGGHGIRINVGEVTVSNNVVTGIGTDAAFGSAAQAIYVRPTSNVSNITISDNTVSDVGLANTWSHKGIFFGDSNNNSALTNVLVSGNTISDVRASQAETGGKGAYGITTNIGFNGSGSMPGLQVIDNTISNLTGRWVHAIGLEGPTPNAVVRGNDISALNASGADESGVFFEGNDGSATTEVRLNRLTGMTYGVAIHPTMLSEGGAARARNNWWGTADGPGVVQAGPGVDAQQWCLDAGCTTFAELGDITVGAGEGFDYATLAEAVAAADPGQTIDIAAGDYDEAVVISKPLTLRGPNAGLAGNAEERGEEARFAPTAGAPLGTIEVDPNVAVVIDGVEIVGLNGNGAVEKAAVYIQGPNTGTEVRNSVIVADGDAGLMSEYNAAIANTVVEDNLFVGQTFTGEEPGGTGFATQFDVGNNVPRQLVVMGGGASGTNGHDVTFRDNVISGTAGGTNSGGEQGNTLVTIDIDDAVVTGNTFEGTTTRFGSALRMRRPVAEFSGNTFVSDDMSLATNHLFLQNQEVAVADLVAANTFDQAVFAASAAGATSTVYAHSVQGAVNEAAVDGTVVALPGTYPGDVNVTTAGLTLQGAGADASELEGIVWLQAPDITVTGFGITDPSGNAALRIRASGATVEGNHLHDIGTETTTAVQAIYVEGTHAALSNVTIRDNLIETVGNTATGTTNKAIFVGDSTADNDVTGLHIVGNTIREVVANDASFASGGRGAYGIHVNAGFRADADGEVVDLVIDGNLVEDLSGHWVHAIGLETVTPDAEVTNNTIRDLTATKTAAGGDAFDDEVGVFFEGNTQGPSVVVTGNTFDGVMAYAVATHPDLEVADESIDARRNFWGADGPSAARLGAGDARTSAFDFVPWLSSPGGSDVFPSGTIAGRVVDGNGNGVANVTISVDGTGDATAVTGSDGRYSVARTAGTYTVTMTVPDNTVAGGPTSRVVIVADSGTATADFVVLTQGSIVGHVRDAAGSGVEGATVTLRQDDAVVATDTTDASGAYAFPGEDAGTYTVTVTVPSGYTAGGPITRTVNLASGSSATADFALARTASISGRVVDTAGVARPGVTVTLGGAGTATAVTGADGRYQFTGRTQFGAYTVTITVPTGYTAGGPVSRSVNLASGSSATADFVVAREAAITGQVLDGTGSGVAGITVSIARVGSAAVTRTTDGQGRYQAENLTDFGAYTVTMTVPSRFVATSPTSRSVNLAAGSSATADFALVQVASISGRVLDGAGDPVAGVPVALTGAGTGSGVTDLEGRYRFTDRSQFGAYTVAITLPTGFAAGGPTTRAVNLVSGSSATADFRILEEASVSGQVVDGTGAPVSGVSVAVSGPSSATLTTDGEGRFRLANRTAFGAYTVAITVPTGFAAGGPVTRTVNLAEGSSATADFRVLETASVSGRVTDVTGAGLSGVQVTITPPSGGASTLTTDGQGRYRLAGLGTFGAYTVSVGLPTGFAAGGATTRSVNLANGSSATADFVLAATSSISGQVVDSTGSGVAGVQVAVTRGSTTANLVTDGQGRYRVANLSSFGAYTVTMTVPSGFVANGPTARAVNLASGSSASADFGLVQVASISGRVVDGAGEPVAGVAVALSGAGTAPAAMTDTDGRYRFTGRTQFGAYSVAITVPTGFAAGGPVTRTVNLAAGSSATADFRILEEASVSGQVLDGSGAPVAGVTVTIGGPSSATLTTDGQGRYRLANRTQFGAYSVVITVPTGFAAGGAITRTVNLAEGSSATADFRLIETAAIAGQVTDATGAGLSGVQVALSGGGTVATDGQGRYRFANLTPGSFTVTVTVPTGFAAGGVTARTVNLASGSSASADFTLAAVASIAGQVVDAAGAPVAGVTVTLSGAGTGTTQTDASGNYRFANRSQFGRYDVTITVPTGFTANGPTARIVNLASGQAATASFALTQTGTISGQVVDNTLTGVSGVEVALDGGTPVLTDAEGRYRFTGLPVGASRVVTVTVPAGFEALDDANTATTTVGDAFDVILLPLGTVSGYLFIDIDGDNVRDPGEPALAGVRVDLMVDGSSVANTTTAADGFYLFTNTPGDATVLVDLDGYVQPTSLFTESSFRSFSMAFSAGDFSLASSHDTTTAREDVGLLPAGTIVGTVRTTGGDAVAGVSVALSGHASRNTTTSSDGAFSFLSLPNGSAGHDYTLSITAPSGFTLQGAGSTAVSLAVTTAASRSFTLAAAAADTDEDDDTEVTPDEPDDTPVALNPDRPTLTTTPRDTNATWRDSNGTTRLSLDLTGARSRSGTTEPVFDAVRIAAPESPGSAVAALGREGVKSAGMAGATEAIRLTVTGVEFEGGTVCPTDVAPGQRIIAFDGKNLLGRDITTTVDGQTCGRLEAADGDVVVDLLVVDLDAPSFSDVAQTSPHFLAVEALSADTREILRGTADGDFDAGGSLRRDQAASILARALGLDLGDADGGFPDVPTSGTHAAAIAALMELDPPVITGFSDGTFRPGSFITRDQLASIVVRAYQDQLEAPSGDGFPDVPSDSVHADAIDRLINSGAIAGFTDGTFGSGRDISRAQVASVVARSLYRTTD